MSEGGEVPKQILDEQVGKLERQEGDETWTDVNELPFANLQIGSHFRVYYSQDLDDKSPRYYDVDVNGIRKDGLRVSLKPDIPETISRWKKVERLTARIPGSYRGVSDDHPSDTPVEHETGVTPGVIKVSNAAETNRFYFENPKDLDGNRLGKSNATAPIRRISVLTTSPKPLLGQPQPLS